MDSGVPQILLNWEILQVTIATVQLECPVGDVMTGLRGDEFCHGAELGGVVRGGVKRPGGMSDHESGGEETSGHFCQRKPQVLVVCVCVRL